MKRLGTLQGRSDRTDNGDLEPIEDPSDAKPDDDEKVKTAPRQSIETEWDICLHDTESGASCSTTPEGCAAGVTRPSRSGSKAFADWIAAKRAFGRALSPKPSLPFCNTCPKDAASS